MVRQQNNQKTNGNTKKLKETKEKEAETRVGRVGARGVQAAQDARLGGRPGVVAPCVWHKMQSRAPVSWAVLHSQAAGGCRLHVHCAGSTRACCGMYARTRTGEVRGMRPPCARAPYSGPGSGRSHCWRSLSGGQL